MKPILFFVCLLVAHTVSAQDTLQLMDSTRHRIIPIAIYTNPAAKAKKQLVIISHGYNNNRPGSYLGYSYLAKSLADAGYFVVSIQHELPTDSLLPTTGSPRETRFTNWERGAENIHFVLQAFAKPGYKVALIGHSNGGDMSVLFAHRYPAEAEKIITLDNRRMEFPRVSPPAFLTLRSSEFQADPGVLPTEEEIKKMNMKIVQLPATRHGDMSDMGTDAQHEEIMRYILSFL